VKKRPVVYVSEFTRPCFLTRPFSNLLEVHASEEEAYRCTATYIKKRLFRQLAKIETECSLSHCNGKDMADFLEYVFNQGQYAVFVNEWNVFWKRVVSHLDVHVPSPTKTFCTDPRIYITSTKLRA